MATGSTSTNGNANAEVKIEEVTLKLEEAIRLIPNCSGKNDIFIYL